MHRTISAVLTAAALSAVGTAAVAQDSRFFVRAGPGYLAPDEDAEISAGGGVVPGANVSIDSSPTVAAEFGYMVTPSIAVGLTGGLPPTEDVNGVGALAPLGKLGELNYGPAALTAQYRLNPFGPFQPYVGAGVAVMYVFSEEDASASNLEVDNAVGPAVQVGAEYMINERWGVFLDYKKAFFDTTSTGTIPSLGGPLPFTADIQVDPSFLHGGVAFRF